MYEYRSGYPSDIGIPSILWIAMGLQETDGMAGVYNRYQQTTFAEHDFQQEPAAQEGKEYIRERLREFRENPAMARYFFKRKLEDQWIEPLFSSLKATESFDTDGEPLASGITNRMDAGQLLPEYRILGRTCTWNCFVRKMVAKKRNSDSIVAAVDWHSRWLPVQYHLGSAEQICISVLCIFDPLCADGTL